MNNASFERGYRFQQQRIVHDLQQIARDKERLDQLWVDIVIAAMELQFCGQEPLSG